MSRPKCHQMCHRPGKPHGCYVPHHFEKLMMRVNEEIGKGIEAGEQSRLILPT